MGSCRAYGWCRGVKANERADGFVPVSSVTAAGGSGGVLSLTAPAAHGKEATRLESKSFGEFFESGGEMTMDTRRVLVATSGPSKALLTATAMDWGAATWKTVAAILLAVRRKEVLASTRRSGTDAPGFGSRLIVCRLEGLQGFVGCAVPPRVKQPTSFPFLTCVEQPY